MARKLLLALIFDWGSWRPINLFVKNSEPGMIKFTNQRYLFHRDSKYVLKNLEKQQIIEMSDDFSEPVSQEAIKAIIEMMNLEMWFMLPDITTPVAKQTPPTKVLPVEDVVWSTPEVIVDPDLWYVWLWEPLGPIDVEAQKELDNQIAKASLSAQSKQVQTAYQWGKKK